MKTIKKDMTFESAINRLENIVELLRNGGAPLDESMKLYEEGAALAAFCTQKLENAEQNVKKINGTSDKDTEKNESPEIGARP